MCALGIRQACVVHTLLISYERIVANAGRTQLNAVKSHATSGIRYE